MPEPSVLLLFAASALALLLVPGPAVLYIVARSVEGGRAAGLASVLGVATGALVHVAAAALGLSSLLVSSATAYTAVRYAGAAYLVFLGLRTLLARTPGAEAPTAGARSRRRLFGQGVVVNVLNPKTALFFFAFLPQFVDVGAGAVGAQIALLGCLFVAMGVVTDGAYAIAAGAAAGWARRRPRLVRAQRWASGTVLVGLGAAGAAGGDGRARN
jgi:threonine/homoserine/homoserine lactone efflux protein